MKLWLMSLKVFGYLFGDSKNEILSTLRYIQESKREAESLRNGRGNTLEALKSELEIVMRQIDNLYLDKLSGEIDVNMYKRLSKN